MFTAGTESGWKGKLIDAHCLSAISVCLLLGFSAWLIFCLIWLLHC